MQAVIKPDRSPGLRLARMPIPDAGAREALIKVAATSICGTDLHIFKWDPWARSRINPPVIVGHEFCGYVVAVGSMVQEVQVGDFVSAESHIVCHTCAPCRTGQAHLCQNTQIIGVDRHGCWADYIVMPVENLWINTPDLPLGVASLQENFGNAVHTAFTTDLTARNVLVTGCGPVGLMTIMVAKAAGAKRIYATDISNYRLRMAGDMGADLALNVSEHRAAQVIMEDTGGDGVDVLLEMSGAPQAIDLGFSLLRFGGEAALLGLAPSAIPFDINNHIVLKGATVYGIVGRQIWGTWFRMRGLLGSGRLDLSRVITHEYTLANYEKAIRVMQNGQSGKVAMYPGGVPT
ncbi:MAG: L-threonine 3-dehydrogenase [Chloroflexi bacterium]|nr:L-threonine 3-dehydrogenase [Chloroflexota bacterium]